MPAGTNVPSGVLVTPGGQQGIPGPNAVSADAGNQATFGSDARIYVPQFAGGKYYGVDSTNTQNYAVTVASDFVLAPGVLVWVTSTGGSNVANPTLNVNGTGAKSIVNRANVALNVTELKNNGNTFGVVYDGTSWRVITPLARYASFNNSANPTVECAGFDSVGIFCSSNSAGTGLGITLNHVGNGVSVMVELNLSVTGVPYFIKATDINGATTPVTWWVWSTSSTAAAAGVNISGGASTITGTGNLMFNGMMMGGNLWLK